MTIAMHPYLREPEAIYARSFALIEAEAGAALAALPAALRPVARRLIHSSGMTDIPADLAWSGPVATAARTALENGATLFCDVAMVEAGIIRRRLPALAAVSCTLADPRVPALAAALGTTRSAAAVELWRDRLDGAVVVVGNAPTALFHLLDRLASWHERPAAILAFPVGFVGAAESKEALIAAPLDIPFLTLRGRRGGSAMAAAAVNTAFEIAFRLLSRAHQDSVHLQPQKLHGLLLLAQGCYAARYGGRPLVPAAFVARPRGPLEPVPGAGGTHFAAQPG